MTGDEVMDAIARYKAASQEVEDWEATEGSEFSRRKMEVYGKRKAARNRLAEVLQEAGLTSFTIGTDR